jgi:hypothetical protein
MPFKDVVDPEQRAVLTAVLNDICLAAGTDPQSPESNDSAGLLMHLYRIGSHTADDLKDALEAAGARNGPVRLISVSTPTAGHEIDQAAKRPGTSLLNRRPRSVLVIICRRQGFEGTLAGLAGRGNCLKF